MLLIIYRCLCAGCTVAAHMDADQGAQIFNTGIVSHRPSPAHQGTPGLPNPALSSPLTVVMQSTTMLAGFQGPFLVHDRAIIRAHLLETLKVCHTELPESFDHANYWKESDLIDKLF